MTSHAQELVRAALALPVSDRADVAAELLASLDESAETDRQAVEAAWHARSNTARVASSTATLRASYAIDAASEQSNVTLRIGLPIIFSSYKPVQ